MNKQLKSNIFLLSAAIIWGFAFVAQCMVDEDVLGVFSFNALRHLLGGISLIPVILIMEKEEKNPDKFKKTVFYGIITGFVLFISSSFQMSGIEMTKSAGKSGFLTGLYIVIVPFYSAILYKKRIKLQEILASLIALLGLYLLSVTDGFQSVTLGDIMVIISAFFWAVHIICIDKFIGDVSPIKFSCVQFFACGVFSFIGSILFENMTVHAAFSNWLPILYAGVLSAGAGYTLQALGQRDANPNSACIIMSLEGLFSVVGGALFLNEVMTLRAYFGCVLMLAGAILSQIKLKKL